MTDFTREDEIKFVIEPQITPYCGPLFFGHLDEPEPVSVTANATFGLVDTGSKKLLVTNLHVWEGFQEQREADPKLRIFVCLDPNKPVMLPMEPLACSSKPLDMVTFDLEPLLQACAGRKFYSLKSVYSGRLRKGDMLFFLGYPGCFRWASGSSITFGHSDYAINLTGVDGLRFYSDISKARGVILRARETNLHSQSLSPNDPDLHAGISGSPCFRIDSESVQAHLVGFMHRIMYTSGLLWFTHAMALNTDGTMDENRKLW